jgi:hypothetical protein
VAPPTFELAGSRLQIFLTAPPARVIEETYLLQNKFVTHKNYSNDSDSGKLGWRSPATVWTVRIQIPVAVTDFSLLLKVQASSGTHPASYSKDTEVLSWD